MVKRRTYAIFRHQKLRAEELGIWLDYTLDDLRSIVQLALSRANCPYCQDLMTAKTFSADHKIPVARGGGMGMNNIIICCTPCNQVKGALDAIEYKELLSLVNGWSIPVKKNLFARIRAGSKYAQYSNKPQSLIGSDQPD